MGRKKGSASSKPLKLPGFGLSITSTCTADLVFPTAVEDPPQRERITIREYQMMLFMNRLTDKPEWDRKIYDDTICAKWRDEALSLETLSEGCIDWCLTELKHEANLFKETGIVRALDGGIFKADSIIPPDVKEALKNAITPLEDVPERLKDWHPGSDGKVLNLVHPSLFPLVYGRSRILSEGKIGLDDCIQRTGAGERIKKIMVATIIARKQAPKSKPKPLNWSKRFQWLPCDVRFEADENRVKIESYINNLHPQIHRGIYSVIEEILSRTIPLFNQTLAILRSPELHPPRIPCDGIYYPDQFADECYPGDEDDDEAAEAWWHAREPIQPEPEGEYAPAVISESDRMDLKGEFSDSGLQVIVKLQSIHLTPEKPEYEGGSWHVAGQVNEHICATGLYYYDSQNITENAIAFWCQVNNDLIDFDGEQNDETGFQKIFGVSALYSPVVQDLGDVITKEDRLITFPNVNEMIPLPLHSTGTPLCPFCRYSNTRLLPSAWLTPASLATRKFSPSFLSTQISVSSPQPMYHASRKTGGQMRLDICLSYREIFDLIIDGVDKFPISMEEAKTLREELMDEEWDYIHDQNEGINQVQFGFRAHP